MTDYFNPARTASSITLSSGNSVATRGAAAAAWASTIGVTAQSSGKLHFEVVVGALTNKDIIGLADASEVTSNYIGQTTHSTGLHTNGSLYYSNGSIQTLTPYAAGDVLAFDVDFSGRFLWIKKNGVSMYGTPGSGGGISLPVSGALYPACSLFQSGSVATLRVLDSEFTSPTTGFSAWGGASASPAAVGAATSRRSSVAGVATGSGAVTVTAVAAAVSRRSAASVVAAGSTSTAVGPSVSVSDTTARIGFRAPTAATVAIKYGTSSTLSGATTTSGLAVTSTTDYTGKIDLPSLSADTVYYYTPVFDGVDQYAAPYPTFKTFPAASTPASFSFAFGSCTRHGTANGIAEDTIFGAIPSGTRFLMHLGDTIYADTDAPTATTLAGYRAKHRDTLAAADVTSANYKTLRASTPVFTTWDDHDIINDFSAGTGNSLYAPAKQAFQEYQAQQNPDGPTTGELYYSFQYGDVGFFVTDGRSFRSVNSTTDNSSKTLLGSTQKTALKTWLLANKTSLKVKFIVSSTTASGYASNTGPDSWGGVDDGTQAPNAANGFRTERNEIFDYIDANQIGGVVILSGDQHWAGSFASTYAGRARYEFLSSSFNSSFLTPVTRAANSTTGPIFWKKGSVFNAGVVSVDTTVSPATVAFQLYEPSGSSGSSYLTTLDTNQIDSGLVAPAAVIAAKSRRSTASGIVVTPLQAVVSAKSRRSTAVVVAAGYFATPTAVIHATSRRSKALAYVGLVPSLAVVGAKSRKSTANASVIGVTPPPPVSYLQGRRSTLDFRISKDGGRNWSDWRQNDLGSTGDFLMPIEMRRFGSARQWIFDIRVTDPVRCDIIAGSTMTEGTDS